MSFWIRMEDSFAFHVGKRVASHLFCLWHEISNIENRRQSSFIQLSSSFLADDRLDLTCSLKRGNYSFSLAH